MRYIKTVVSFYKGLIAPRSKDKNMARREYILNVLLVNALVLSFVLTISSWITILLANYFGYVPSGLSPNAVFFVFLFFVLCYVFSRKGFIKVSAYLLLFIYFVGATYTAYRWGVSVPQSLLTYALLIVTAGILLNPQSAFVFTFVISFVISSLVYLQSENILPVSFEWTEFPPHLGDAVVYSVTLFVIAVVAWLSNREMEKALARAENSEQQLREERDNLELILDERTKALQQTQMEKMMQLERFAEFGRISSGLIHDLATPLNLISLNLQRLNVQEKKRHTEKMVQNNSMLLTRAITGVKRLEGFVASARRQIENQELTERFSLSTEINQILQVLTYYAKERKVVLKFSYDKEIKTYGYPVKFHQVMTNLMVNAIDSYGATDKADQKREVLIRINKVNNSALIEVQDYGEGIAKAILPHIFEPFFTTKTEKGLGIGLSLCKEIAERDFDGDIAVVSSSNAGTTFTFAFPIKRKSK